MAESSFRSTRDRYPRAAAGHTRVSFRTNHQIPAPVFLQQEHLLALDSIFDAFEARADSDRNEFIEKETDARLLKTVVAGADASTAESRRSQIRRLLERSVGRNTRTATIYLSKGDVVESNRFGDALNLPNTVDQMPQGFRYFFARGRISATVEVMGSKVSPGLEVSVLPDDVNVAQELFGSLQNWAEDLRPDTWLRIWSRLSNYLGVVGAVGWIGVCSGAHLVAAAWTSRYSEEAARLMKEGVNATNQYLAIQVILELQTQQLRINSLPPMGSTFWRYLVAGICISLLLGFSPPNVVALWRGRKTLRRWRSWITAVSVTIPGLILTTVLWPRLLRLFGL